MEIENVDYLLINFEKIPHELINPKKKPDMYSFCVEPLGGFNLCKGQGGSARCGER